MTVALRAAIERDAWLAQDFDVDEWAGTLGNIVLEDGPNVALFEVDGDRIYTTHWLFEARGREALRLGREFLNDIFEMHEARAVKGLTPVQCRGARWFNRQLGGASLGFVETVRGQCEIFFLSRKMWAERR